MRLVLVLAVCVAALAIASSALAVDPGTQGQPSESCGSLTAPSTPGGGNSSTSTGSPFAGASSAGVYANGPGTSGPNGAITNSNAVSQYDVACFQVSQPH